MRVGEHADHMPIGRNHQRYIARSRDDFRQEFGIDKRHRHASQKLIRVSIHELFASFAVYPTIRDNGDLSTFQSTQSVWLKADGLKCGADVIEGKVSTCA